MLNPKHTLIRFVIGKGNQMAYVAAFAVAAGRSRFLFLITRLLWRRGTGVRLSLDACTGHQMLQSASNAKVKYVLVKLLLSISSIDPKTKQQKSSVKNIEMLILFNRMTFNFCRK